MNPKILLVAAALGAVAMITIGCEDPKSPTPSTPSNNNVEVQPDTGNTNQNPDSTTPDAGNSDDGGTQQGACGDGDCSCKETASNYPADSNDRPSAALQSGSHGGSHGLAARLSGLTPMSPV